MPTKRTIVFDLDGTLADTNADLIPALNRTTEACGLAPVRVDEVGHVVGSGARAMIEKAFALRGRSAPDPEELDRLFVRFVEVYRAHIADHTTLYDGVLTALERLEADGWVLAVCTNKMEALSVELLARLGVADRFAAICGGDTFAVKKPEAGHLTGTVERAGGDPACAVMVGDSRNDILAARAAAIPVVAVDFGYSDVPVAELSPDRIISHYDQLVEIAVQLCRG